MYSSITEICSAALLSLGQEAINDISDPNDRARLCKGLWPMVLDDELSLHRWKCAKKRATLAQDAVTPAFGWAYKYQLPNDNLRVLSMSDESVEYEIEGTFLLTNNSSAKILYLFRNTVVGTYSPGLVSSLVARLAAELSMPVTKKESVVKAGWAAYWGKVAQSVAADGQQGTPVALEDRTLVDAGR